MCLPHRAQRVVLRATARIQGRARSAEGFARTRPACRRRRQVANMCAPSPSCRRHKRNAAAARSTRERASVPDVRSARRARHARRVPTSREVRHRLRHRNSFDIEVTTNFALPLPSLSPPGPGTHTQKCTAFFSTQRAERGGKGLKNDETRNSNTHTHRLRRRTTKVWKTDIVIEVFRRTSYLSPS